MNKIINKTTLLAILFLSILFLNAFPFIWIDLFLKFKLVFLFFNLLFGLIFTFVYIFFIKKLEKEKNNIKKLLKTGKNEKIKNMKFDNENDLYKIFKRTYIAKNILEKDVNEIKENFNKLVANESIKGIGKGLGDEIKIGLSVKKRLHIMFIDISGFTGISEKIDSDKALMLLNIYFDGIVEITKTNGGYVDKFLGDGIMVVFDLDKSDKVLNTAVEIIKLIKKINIGKYKDRINMGIGINSGEVILGTIGSRDRMEISIIGDTVNTASRLEHLTRENEDWIIFSESTYNLLENKKTFKIDELGKKEIKGKKENMYLYGIQI